MAHDAHYSNVVNIDVAHLFPARRVVRSVLFAILATLLLQAGGSEANAQGFPSSEPRRYTHHPGSAGAPRIIAMTLEGQFTAAERAGILRAIEEWNYALNGFIRLDVVAPGSARGIWSIRAEKGGTPVAPNPVAGQALSSTTANFWSSGGEMLIYVDRIGTRDLRGIVLHELGHVLGLEHDPTGNLMSARYQPSTEQCIDRPTASMIAARHNLPLAALNWCEAAAPTR
jgi:hypothetical protein